MPFLFVYQHLAYLLFPTFRAKGRDYGRQEACHWASLFSTIKQCPSTTGGMFKDMATAQA
jgi:hypothetical protein